MKNVGLCHQERNTYLQLYHKNNPNLTMQYLEQQLKARHSTSEKWQPFSENANNSPIFLHGKMPRTLKGEGSSLASVFTGKLCYNNEFVIDETQDEKYMLVFGRNLIKVLAS